MELDEYDGMRLMVLAGQKVIRREEPKSRAESMAAARELGTHTEAEWRAVVQAAGGACRYCDVELNVFNGVQDHKVPVTRGGSDAAENLDYICWQCNAEKYLCTPEEWSYTGPRPRPFKPSPRKAREFARLVARAR